MTLLPGSRLGPYEVVAFVGVGGMGEVYKARDTRLDRTVALKVLPAQVASDPQFRERFEREARVVSSLDHPHICALYDVGRERGVDFLVMQFLDGETLASRLMSGPLPLDQALGCAIEACSALAAAHRKGIVHRDLKPGNVMLTKSGAKLLDFGLAKTTAMPVAAGVSVAPTQEAPLTAQGTILGTLQYMAPEQLEGKEADPRTDIFAFGAMLYEMLTGRKAFEGRSQASLITAIMSAQPVPITACQPLAPPAIDHIVRTCLAKDPDARFQSAHDLLMNLKWIVEDGSPTAGTAPMGTSRRWRARLGTAASVAGAMVIASLATWWLTRPQSVAAPSVVRATIALPATASVRAGRFTVANVAISPDGTHIVYAGAAGDDSQLYLRSLDRTEVMPIAGTGGALNPFFSPDGQWVAFYAGGKLKKVPIVGGGSLTLCDADFAFGGAWSDDGTIVFGGSLLGGLLRVSSNGGQPEAFTTLENGEGSHRWPSLVPGSRDVLFAIGSE